MIPVPSHQVPWSPYRYELCFEAPRGVLQGPYTHKVGSWSHHLVDDVEDLTDDVEDPGDCVKALVDDGESLDGLKKH